MARALDGIQILDPYTGMVLAKQGRGRQPAGPRTDGTLEKR